MVCSLDRSDCYVASSEFPHKSVCNTLVSPRNTIQIHYKCITQSQYKYITNTPHKVNTNTLQIQCMGVTSYSLHAPLTSITTVEAKSRGLIFNSEPYKCLLTGIWKREISNQLILFHVLELLAPGWYSCGAKNSLWSDTHYLSEHV